MCANTGAFHVGWSTGKEEHACALSRGGGEEKKGKHNTRTAASRNCQYTTNPKTIATRAVINCQPLF